MLQRLPPELRLHIYCLLYTSDVVSVARAFKSLKCEALHHLYSRRFVRSGGNAICSMLYPSYMVDVRSNVDRPSPIPVGSIIKALSLYLHHASHDGVTPSLDLCCRPRRFRLPVLHTNGLLPTMETLYCRMSILYVAALVGAEEVVEFLLRHGADCAGRMWHSPDSDRHARRGGLAPVTPLLIATLAGHAGIVRKLLRQTGVQARACWLPALASGFSLVVAAFLDRDPTLIINGAILGGMTPLEYLSWLDMEERHSSAHLISTLVRAGAKFRVGVGSDGPREGGQPMPIPTRSRTRELVVRPGEAPMVVRLDRSGLPLTMYPKSGEGGRVDLRQAGPQFSELISGSLTTWTAGRFLNRHPTQEYHVTQGGPDCGCPHFGGEPEPATDDKSLVFVHPPYEAASVPEMPPRLELLLRAAPTTSDAGDVACAVRAARIRRYAGRSSSVYGASDTAHHPNDQNAAEMMLLRHVFTRPGSAGSGFLIFPPAVDGSPPGRVFAHDVLAQRQGRGAPHMDICILDDDANLLRWSETNNIPLSGICRVDSRCEQHDAVVRPPVAGLPVVLSVLHDLDPRIGVPAMPDVMAEWHVAQFRAMKRAVEPGCLTVRLLIGIVIQHMDWLLIRTEVTRVGYKVHQPVHIGMCLDTQGALGIIQSLYGVRRWIQEDIAEPYKADLMRRRDGRQSAP